MKTAVSVFLAIATAILASTAFAQSQVEMDAVAYRLDSSQTQVELYYGIIQRFLNFTQAGDIWTAPVHGTVELLSNGKVVASQEIRKEVRIVGSQAVYDSMSASKMLAGAAFVTKETPDGIALLWDYKGSDGTPYIDTIRKTLVLPSADRSHFGLGGVELASEVTPSGKGLENPFEKVGYVITPNPSNLYGENYTKLYYYTELYVPSGDVNASKQVEITTKIVDAEGREIVSQSRSQELVSNTIPLIGSVDIDGLPSGKYRLQLGVRSAGALEAEQTKMFFVVSEMKISEEEAPSATTEVSFDELYRHSEFSQTSENDLEEVCTQSLYLGTDDDKRAYKKLGDLDAKRHFLFNFWVKRDQANEAPLTEFESFKKRVAIANKQFTYQRTPGWKSDRGRIFIMYGEPQIIGGEKFAAASNAYITWEYENTPNFHTTSVSPGVPSSCYNPPGGSRPFFIFLDRQGGGSYSLVHSNVLGHSIRADWYSSEASRLAH